VVRLVWHSKAVRRCTGGRQYLSRGCERVNLLDQNARLHREPISPQCWANARVRGWRWVVGCERRSACWIPSICAAISRFGSRKQTFCV
jgi:hypothetical protein